MTDTTTPGAGDHISRAAMSTGSMLRDAREAAGLTLDMVAQQLKLAPRQVIALEEGDYGSLPGRTFVRGFVRNYARLLHIDADHVLAGLPGSDTDALHSPVLHPTAPTIGDLPTEDKIKPGWTRWAIPVALVVVIASGVLYEFTRGRSENRVSTAAPVTETEQKTTVGLASAPATPAPDSVPLPSPLATPHSAPSAGIATPQASATAGSSASTPTGRTAPTPPAPNAPGTASGAIGATAVAGLASGSTATTRPTAAPTTPGVPPAPATSAQPPRAAAAPAPTVAPAPTSASPATPAAPVPTTRPAPPTATPTASQAAPPPPPARSTPLANPFSNPLSNPFAGTNPSSAPPTPAAAPGTVTMVLTLRKASRTDVKDATGRTVLSETVPAGQTRTVTGTPPFDVVISNATDATLTYRGKQIDITPYTRQKVARFRLL